MALRSFVVLLCLLLGPDASAVADREDSPKPNLLAARFVKARSNALDSAANRLLEKALAISGVQAAAILDALPERDRPSKQCFLLLENSAGRLPAQATMRRVSPGYFQAARLPLVRGRPLSDRDVISSPPVAVVSQALAKQAWPGEDPLGKRFSLSNDPMPLWLTVVGIVLDPAVPELGQAGEAVIYLPIAQSWPKGAFVLLVRTEGDPHKAAPPLRELIDLAFGELRSDGVRVISRAGK